MPKPAHLGSLRDALMVVRKSKRPMITTRDVSLKKPINVLTKGGIARRGTWGSPTARALRPHFGQYASVEKLERAIKAEAYGFDPAWVRFHLVFTPYDMEGTDNTHIEGLLVLSARFRSSDWYQQIDLLGNEVGPAL